MGLTKHFFGTFLILIFVVITAVVAVPERAHLIVHKKVPEYEAALGRNFTFTFLIFNTGSGSAYDLNLIDTDWPSAQFDVEGDNSAQFDSLAPGSNITHSYSIIPKTVGRMNIPRATVEYKLSEDAEDTVIAYSSDLPQLPILTASEYDKVHDEHYDEFAFTVLFMLIPIGLPYVLYMYTSRKTNTLARDIKRNVK